MGMEITVLKIEDIVPNPHNPNKFSEENLDKLILDIKTHGLKYPLLVRKKDNKFEMIDGEHRMKALRTMGETTAPARVLEMTDDDALKTIINLKRIQGTFGDYEFARAIEILAKEGDTERLAEEIFMGEAEIKNIIKRIQKMEGEDTSKILENRQQEKIKVFSFKTIGVQEIQSVQKALNTTGILNNPDLAFKELCREYIELKTGQKVAN